MTKKYVNFRKIAHFENIPTPYGTFKLKEKEIERKEQRNNMSATIEIRDLTFQYNQAYASTQTDPVFKDLSLTFEKGNRYVITGLNGCGKSTLLKLIGGKTLTQYDAIKVNDKDPFRETSCNFDIAFINNDWGTQTVAFTGYNVPLQSSLKVKEMMVKLKQTYPERNQELIDVLGINEEWAMNAISEGQRKRVQLYLGLIQPFKVCLLDEITVNLDILVKHRFMDYLKRESMATGATILYVTHIFDGLDDWYSHLIYIKKNREIILQTKEKINDHPENKEIYPYLLHEFLKEERTLIKQKEKEEKPNDIYKKNAGGYSDGVLTEIVL